MPCYHLHAKEAALIVQNHNNRTTTFIKLLNKMFFVGTLQAQINIHPSAFIYWLESSMLVFSHQKVSADRFMVHIPSPQCIKPFYSHRSPVLEVLLLQILSHASLVPTSKVRLPAVRPVTA